MTHPADPASWTDFAERAGWPPARWESNLRDFELARVELQLPSAGRSPTER
ncbi:MAG: hypothetical protein V3T72_08610 [Thermoanaerobaculia bacterium]